MYAYRLLRLPNDHVTKQILPYSFRNGDAENVQADDEPEDSLIWAGIERPNSLGQWLARQVSITQAVDPAYGVEPIEKTWRLDIELPLEVVIQPKKSAIQEAKKTQCGIVLWTDGSRVVERVGAAVVLVDKRLGKWREKRRFLGKHKDSFDVELWAISDALNLDSKETRNAEPTTVTIFTNSQTAMTKILEPKTKVGGDAIRNLIYQRARTMKNAGHTIVLRWVPSHSKVLGNEKAEEAAKDVAHRGGRETDHWSSLTHIKAELQRTRLAELSAWHELKSQEREATVQEFYDPVAKSGINPTLGSALKKYAMRFYQLRIGHGAVGAFLAKIGVINTPECWWCGAHEQTVIHLYTECRRWRKERRKLRRKLGRLAIRWEPRPGRRWLGGLLANERAIIPILQFLKNTEVGSRNRTMERELEWQRRRDEEGEDQLTD